MLRGEVAQQPGRCDRDPPASFEAESDAPAAQKPGAAAATDHRYQNADEH